LALFRAHNVFAGSTVGCGVQGRSGVTEVGHSYSMPVGAHEIGHQLAGDHDKSYCWCHAHKVDWDWGCWCLKTKCKTEYCTLMNPGIRSSTGDIVLMKMSDANKNEARAVSHFAFRQHDANTWNHCGWENGVCHCQGTVRYGRHGKWASPRPVRGQISCSNSAFGDPYYGTHKECQCLNLQWENLGSGGCMSLDGRFYKRYVLVSGQYGFSGTVESCKQLCAKYDDCFGINFVNYHNHCHLNVGNDRTLSGVGWNIHAGTGYGPIDRAAKGSWTDPLWQCHRILNL